MSRAAVLQQQTPPARVVARWSFEAIAAATACPLGAVSENWPRILSALDQRGIAERDVCRAAIATVAIETASTFEPVREAFWLSEDWRRANLRYYPWYGRGFIQLSWQTNYQTYGRLLGVDLLSDPDRALDPDVAAQVLAEYFRQVGVDDVARDQNWTAVRERVQGGTAGLDRLITIVHALEAT